VFNRIIVLIENGENSKKSFIMIKGEGFFSRISLEIPVNLVKSNVQNIGGRIVYLK
jgi:uncharacterized protein YegP (UPF0339 family)